MSKLDLSSDDAIVYLYDLSAVLTALAHTLAAIAQLIERTPAGAPPQAMLEALTGSWESLDSRFHEVYDAVYGGQQADDAAAGGSSPQEGLG